MADKTKGGTHLQEIFKQAAEIASVVPEPMQDAAFKRALELLLDEEAPSSKRKTPIKSRPTSKKKNLQQEQPADNFGTLEKELNRTKYPQIQAGLGVLEQALYVLLAAKNEKGIDGLTSREISNLLTHKFRIKTTYNAVSMALSKAGNLVDRFRRGNSYVYRIMQAGEDYLLKLEAGETPELIKRITKKTAKSQKSKSKEIPKLRGRPSPKSILETLIAERFFDTEKTITEIKDFLEINKGYVYSTSDITTPLRRLVWDGTLSRRKNDKNQYEYSQPNN